MLNNNAFNHYYVGDLVEIWFVKCINLIKNYSIYARNNICNFTYCDKINKL